MPVYCFQDKEGFIHERFFKMADVPKSIDLGARGIAKRCWGAEDKSVPSEKGWPIECVASGGNAKQRNELVDYFKKKGVPTDVTKDGNPVYRDKRHRDKALKARGYFDKNAYC